MTAAEVATYNQRFVFRNTRRFALERDQRTCQRCGAGGCSEVDHVVPLRGASYTEPHELHALGNLQTLCGPCHKRKTAADNAESRRLRSQRRLAMLTAFPCPSCGANMNKQCVSASGLPTNKHSSRPTGYWPREYQPEAES